MRAIVIISTIIAITGCSSWVDSTRKSVTGDSGPRKAKQDAKWVSKNQYDDLMVKYKNLLSEYEKVKSGSSSSGPDISSEVSNPNLTESVNVFVPKEAVNKNDNNFSVSDASRELKLFKKSEALYSTGKTEEALKAFQVLQKSPTSQIRVRSKRYIAYIYMRKQQYDLALQVLEQIIQTDAFSAVVLEALESAVECCQKLGLEEKRAQYNSMLKDVFNLG